MYAVIGTFCLVIAVLGFGGFMLVSRKPNPPAWTGLTVAHEVAAIGIVSLAGFGTSFLLQTLGQLDKEPLAMTHMIAIAAIIAGFIVAWTRLRLRKTLAEYARQMEDVTPPSRPVSPLQPKKAA